MNNYIKQWNNEGYFLGQNIINHQLILESNKLLNKMYDNGLLNVKDFGSNGKLEFPSNTILDKITLNENIIHIVQKLLNTDDILLSQADTWGKKGTDDYSEQSNNDQRMHMDYGNNSFLHPSPWNDPECVSMIIYLSDTNDTFGGTSIVPRKGENDELYQTPYKNMPGIANNPFFNDKNNSENYFQSNDKEIYDFRQKLYLNEIILKPNIGDILFYRLDTWHRGTPVKNNKVRFVMNLLWKKKECYWINCWNPGWTKNMYYGYLEELITNMSPLQRSVLGIPKPGDKYWNMHKIYFLKIRYPKIDIQPYVDNL